MTKLIWVSFSFVIGFDNNYTSAAAFSEYEIGFDKKASQFMARVTRLNEAFSVLKRIPIVRPSLPPSGITSWPMASLR